MIALPGGNIALPSQLATDGRRSDDPEGDATKIASRLVSVKPFAIGAYDITRDEYADFVSETGRPTHGGCLVWNGNLWTKSPSASWRNPGFSQTGHDPVVCVTWDDAQDYVDWLNRKILRERRSRSDPISGVYRLPTWEESAFAAAGGAETRYYWGNDPRRDRANYGADPCLPCNAAAAGTDHWKYTSPVGSFPPNSFGLYDAAGNVWQWTSDCVRLTDSALLWTPKTRSETCYFQIMQGGSWLTGPEYLQSGWYGTQGAFVATTQTGFRLARDLEKGQ